LAIWGGKELDFGRVRHQFSLRTLSLSFKKLGKKEPLGLVQLLLGSYFWKNSWGGQFEGVIKGEFGSLLDSKVEEGFTLKGQGLIRFGVIGETQFGLKYFLHSGCSRVIGPLPGGIPGTNLGGILGEQEKGKI